MTFRILSLDGGGAWALIEVRALIALYGSDTRGHDVLRRFDLVAANSGGSIVLGGLIENLTLGELRGYFEDKEKRCAVFSPSRNFTYGILQKLLGIGPKYSAEAKLKALESVMPVSGKKPMTEAGNGIKGPNGNDVHLLIVGFDYDFNRAALFRSAHAKSAVGLGVGTPATVTMAEAIHASSNAPVNYFDAPAVCGGDRYWDGAVTGYNNPVLAAVTEAVVLGWKPSDIVALSLGTASVVLPLAADDGNPSRYETPRPREGLLTDVKKMATSIMDDPPDSATFIVHAITGGGEGVPAPAVSRLVRMSPLISPIRDIGGNWTAPAGMTGEQFTALCKIDMDAVESAEVAAIASYTEAWLADKAPNQPLRMNGATLRAEIGYATFSEAAKAWKTLEG